MLNAVIGAAVGAFIVLLCFGFWLLLRSLKEFSASVNGLTSILRPFLGNPELTAIIQVLPALLAEMRSAGKGLGAMTAVMETFNRALLNREATPTVHPEGAAAPADSGFYVYNDENAAGREGELLKALHKEPSGM